eukprot:s1896_g6.t1
MLNAGSQIERTHLTSASFITIQPKRCGEELGSWKPSEPGRLSWQRLDIQSALNLPDSIRKLRLDLARCEIGPEGLKGLRLPGRLTSLMLDLTMCSVGPEQLKAFIATLPKTLEALEMNLTGCKVKEASVAMLQQAVKARLPLIPSPHLVV